MLHAAQLWQGNITNIYTGCLSTDIGIVNALCTTEACAVTAWSHVGKMTWRSAFVMLGAWARLRRHIHLYVMLTFGGCCATSCNLWGC